MSIASNIKATGVSEVMVIVKPQAMAGISKARLSGSGCPDEILKHFVRSEVSRDAELIKVLKAQPQPAANNGAAPPTATSLGVATTVSPLARFYPHLGIALGTVDREGLAALRRETSVAKVLPAPDLRLIKPVAMTPKKPAPGYSWGLKRLGIDKLHAQGYIGEGILIGHLDTGVDAGHRALKGAVHSFAEFDALGALIEDAAWVDSGSHGTHTAGTIAGREVQGVQFGVAPGAQLVSGMVIEGGNPLPRILGGMNWVVGKQVRILNMSLGLIGTSDWFLPVTRILRAKGILPVFAVGNEGPGSSRYPGNYAEALSVGAIDGNDLVAQFSSSQQFVRKQDPVVPDIVAPGVEIVSCVPGGGYEAMSGTSMATPHIAGLAALLMQAVPSASIDAIESAIFRSSRRAAGMQDRRANRGVPDAVLALRILQDGHALAA